jgi:hypothetical protein
VASWKNHAIIVQLLLENGKKEEDYFVVADGD